MRRMTSHWLIDFLTGQWGDVSASDSALIYLHFPWWVRSQESAMVRSNISKLESEEEANDDDDDDDDDAAEVYSKFKVDNFNELVAACSIRVVHLLGAMIDASRDTSDYHNKVNEQC
jgi:hypothetical protein